MDANDYLAETDIYIIERERAFMISVAMAVYNGEKYIVEQLDSLKNQSTQPDEIIICDDGSVDGTCSIIETYRKENPELPISLFKNEKNVGYRLNFKNALAKTSGDYIFLCDQDDIWFENKIHDMIQIMRTNKKIRVLASSFVYMDQDGRQYSTKPIWGMSNNNLYIRPVKENDLVCIPFDDYFTRNFFQGTSLLIRKEIKDEIVKHFTDRIHHDWLINLTGAKYNGMYFWNVPLFAYRIHEKNAVGIQGTYTSTADHIQKAGSLDIRTQLPKEGLKMLQALQESDPIYYSKNINRFQRLKDFYQEHIHALETNDTFTVLKENFNPEYKHMKSLKARIMDVLFTCKGKLKR